MWVNRRSPPQFSQKMKCLQACFAVAPPGGVSCWLKKSTQRQKLACWPRPLPLLYPPPPGRTQVALTHLSHPSRLCFPAHFRISLVPRLSLPCHVLHTLQTSSTFPLTLQRWWARYREAPWFGELKPGSLPCSVTFGELLDLSEPQFPWVSSRMGVMRGEGEYEREAPSIVLDTEAVPKRSRGDVSGKCPSPPTPAS